MQPVFRPPRAPGAFTLLEVLLASVAAAMILVAVYTIFSRAIKLRDDATQRTHVAQLRARAVRTIRRDLENALISGGILASTLESSTTASDANDSAAPGFFKFTTTTGRDTADELYGDVQQVEYYVAKDAASSDPAKGGRLVRSITRDLLETNAEAARAEPLLPGVVSFQVSFYDGANWNSTWTLDSAASSDAGSTGAGAVNLPQAVRIEIQQAAPSASAAVPPPLEILVPWTTQPFAVPAPAAASASS